MAKPHIVITTDLSDSAAAAHGPGAALARKLGGRVTLLHVVEDLPAIPHGAPTAPPQPSPDLAQREAEARQRLGAIAAGFAKDVGLATAVIAGGNVAKAIADFAQEQQASLVVIASRGWSGARGLLLGSTAENLLKRAPVPVLMIPVQSGPHDLGIA